MKWKNIGLKLTTAAVTAAMGFQMTAQPLQAAAASTQYLSEVIISYGSTDAEAKNWLTSNGYKVVNQNLNEGGEGGSDAFSWLGLASEKRSVYLGYKTTTNPDEAITDMKIMNMNGGYSYEAYEKVLEDTKAEKEHFLENIMAALKEYRENYKKGAIKAKIAHDNLNKFKDDDSGALMGDLLLNTLKTEDEAAWEADKTQHADMVTILMQGNSTVVSEIMQNLAFAADTADDSFVNRAIAAANADESPFDTFFNAYMENHPGCTKDEAVTELMQLYDDDAKMFASSLIGLRNYLGNYTQSGLSLKATQDEINAYFASHEFEDETTWTNAANMYTLLSNVQFGDSSLLTYLVYTDDDYLTDGTLLSGYDALGLPQRAKLYPMIAQMSKGQRCLLEYTALDRMLTMGLMDESTWASTYATLNDEALGADRLEPCSVYAMVDRNDFKVGEIAVTNMAQGKQASTGEQISEGLFGAGISYVTAGLFVGGVVTSIAGVAIAAKNWSTGAIKAAVDQGQSLVPTIPGLEGNIDIGIKDNLTRQEIIVKMKPLSFKNVDDLLANIAGGKEDYDFVISNYLKLTNDPSKRKLLIELAIKDKNFKLTAPGPNGDIMYNRGAVINYDPNTNEMVSVTYCDGTVYNMDGTTTVDENLRKQYDEFVKKVNPDIKNAAEQAKDQLDDLAAAAGQNVDEVTKQAVDKWDDMGMAILMSERTEDYLSEFLRVKEMNPDLTLNSLSQKEFDEFADYMKDKYPNSTAYAKIKDVQENNVKSIIDADRANKDGWEIVDKMDDIAEGGQEAADKVDDAAEAAMTAGSGSTFWKWFGVGMAIVGLAMSVYSAYAAITEMQAYYHQEMLPIPRKMVDLGYYEDGTHCYIYYDCAKCNRTEMSMGNETLGDYGDLNGDVMKQWIALYTTKDQRAGSPIQAGFTVKKGTTSIPVRTVPLSFFGFDYAVNMTDTKFTYNNNLNGIYLYYKQLASKYTGTVETGNALVTTGVLSALGGAGICGLIIALASKRKKKEPTSEPTAA